MKTPKFTKEQLEYLNHLLNDECVQEIWHKEEADKTDMRDFRGGQRDGICLAMRAIIADQKLKHSN